MDDTKLLVCGALNLHILFENLKIPTNHSDKMIEVIYIESTETIITNGIDKQMIAIGKDFTIVNKWKGD